MNDEPISPHIVSGFDVDLRDLSRQVLEMGGLAEHQLKLALEALQARDAAAAESIVAGDDRIDKAEVELEEHAVRTLALRQPLARDLRETIAALKIASTLERIGDLAKSIARCVPIIAAKPPVRLAQPLVHMGHSTRQQFGDVLDAYGTRNAEKAMEVWNRDIQIDETYNSLFREITTYMMEDSRTVGTCAFFMATAKNLERIGDHATFIAEMVYFVVEGERLGDDRPKGQPLGLFFHDRQGRGS